MLNWWPILLLLAAAQGMLLSFVLIFPGKKRDRSNPFLGLIIFTIALELLNAWGMQVKYHSSETAIPFWVLQSYLVLPVSLWLFVKSNMNSGFKFGKKYILLYVPSLVEIMVRIANSVRYRFTGHFVRLLNIKPWFFVTEILPVICMVVVLIYFGKNLPYLLQQYKGTIISHSRFFKFKMYGLFVTFLSLTLCWIAAVIFYLPVFLFINAMLVSFLFVLGYIGYARPSFFDALKIPGKKSSESFAQYDDEKESTRMMQLLEQKALHTRPGLTIEEFAHELGLPVRYVSYLVKVYYATNFRDFINSYRVKEVIRKINDPAEKHKKLLAIAFESGFNSKSTFNQVFKNHTGQAPSRYLK
jgi:AraC-like DNA-binding protein